MSLAVFNAEFFLNSHLNRRTTISDILKKRDKLTQFIKMNPDDQENFKRRRALRNTVHKELEDQLSIWYHQLRAQGTYVNGPMIADEAKRLHKSFGYSGSFVASNGWLDRFKTRYGIKLCGLQEVKHVTDKDAIEPFKSEVQQLIKSKNLSYEQIYNSDEFDLFWKMTPNPETETNELKSSVRVYRERFSVLACTNASGSHKLPLVCIGRGKPSRAFSAAELKNLPNLPAHYYSQETAWMDRDIFKDWFLNQFVPSVKIHLANMQLPETAVLFIDCSNAHPMKDMQELQTEDGNISCHFFSSSVKNELQPMQQGIVKNLKRYYRREFLINAFNSGLNLAEFQRQITLNSSIINIVDKWENHISHELIQNCFSKLLPELEDQANVAEDESISITSFETLIRQIPECHSYPSKRILRWLNCDEVDQQSVQRVDENISTIVEEELDEDMTEHHIDEDNFVYIEYPSIAIKDENIGETVTMKAQNDDFIDEQMLMLHDDEEISQNDHQSIEEIGYVQQESSGAVSLVQAVSSLNTLLKFMENDDESRYKDVRMLQELKSRLESRIS